MQEIAQINTHFCVIFAAPLVQTGFRIQIDVIMTSTTLEGRGCDFGGFAGYNTLNDFWPLLLFLHNLSSMLFLHFLFLCSFSFLFISLNDYFFILDFHDIWAVLINDTFMIIFLTQPLRYFSPSIIHYTVFWITYCWFFIPPRIFIAHASMLSWFHFFFHFSTHFLHRSSTIFFSFSFVFHFFSFSFLSFPYQFLINSLSSLSIPSLALWTLSIVQRTGTPKWMISRICSNQKDSSRHVSSFSLFLLGEYFSIVLIVLIVLLLVHGLPLLLLFRREGLCHGTEELEKFTEERLTTTTQTCSSMWFYNDSSLYSMVVLYSLFKYLNFFVPSLLGSYP